jgi:hypothetical protein
MKIIIPNKETRKEILDKTYACEMSGWEIAAITALAYKFAAGDPAFTLRGYCASVEKEGRKQFPFLNGSSGLFDGNCFSESSEETLLRLP